MIFRRCFHQREQPSHSCTVQLRQLMRRRPKPRGRTSRYKLQCRIRRGSPIVVSWGRNAIFRESFPVSFVNKKPSSKNRFAKYADSHLSTSKRIILLSGKTAHIVANPNALPIHKRDVQIRDPRFEWRCDLLPQLNSGHPAIKTSSLPAQMVVASDG